MLRTVAKQLGGMAAAPVRMRRNPPKPPPGEDHYIIPELEADLSSVSVPAVEIPVAKTPPGGWTDWPPPILGKSDEPLVPGAPDLRGVWQVFKGPLKGHIERNEQAGQRVVITAGGVVHDMFADGTMAGGVHDVGVGGTRINVVARFEDERLNLYLNDKRLVVTRYLDGDEMVWRWGPYRNRLRRLHSAADAG